MSENITKVLNSHQHGREARELVRSILACFNVPEPLHMVPGYGNVVESGAYSTVKLVDKAVQSACQAHLDEARAKEARDELQE